MGGGGSSVQSAPEYIQIVHKKYLDEDTDIYDGDPAITNLLDYYAGRDSVNPFEVKRGTATEDGEPVGSIDYLHYQRLLDHFYHLDTTYNRANINDLVERHYISYALILMQDEAEDVTLQATKAWDAFIAKYPELAKNQITQNDLVNVVLSSIEAAYAFYESSQFANILTQFEIEVNKQRDTQVADFKNAVSMAGGHLSSSLIMGIARIHNDAMDKVTAFNSQLIQDTIKQGYDIFLKQYFVSDTYNRDLQIKLATDLRAFIIENWKIKANLDKEHADTVIKTSEYHYKSILDIFEFIFNSRYNNMKWNFDVYQMFGNYIASGMGSNIPIQKMSRTQSALAGAAAGAGIGAAIPGASPLTAGIGAGVGAIAGFLS
jgi:hypothetical protein